MSGGRRLLLIGPVGEQPWRPLQEIAEAFSEVGFDVLVQKSMRESTVVPALPDLPVMGRTDSLLPLYSKGRGIGLSRWVGASRANLRRHRVERVLVWDDEVARKMTIVCWNLAHLTWVRSGGPVGPLTRLARLVLVAGVDGVVPKPGSHLRYARRREVVAPPCDDPVDKVDDASDRWAVLLGNNPIGSEDLDALRRRAATQPAEFVCLDGQEALPRTPLGLAEAKAAARTTVELVSLDAQWTKAGISSALTCGVAAPDRRLREAAAAGITVTSAHDSVEPTVAPTEPLLAWCRAVVPLDLRPEVVARAAQAIEQCPSCDSTKRRVVRRSSGGTTAVKCTSCGMTYADRLLPPDVLHASSYHDGTGLFGADYSHSISERASFDIAELRLRDLDSVSDAQGSLLDVGAGYGHFVSAARAHGWRAEGLEVVPQAAERAREQYGVTMHVGDVLSFRPSQRYDVVSFGQTLEHMREPVRILRHVREALLAPRGLLLLELPNVRSVARTLAGPYWMHWQPGDHALYPDARSMRALLGRVGFEVELMKSDSMMFDWMPTAMVAHNLGATSRPVLGGGVAGLLSRLPHQEGLAATLRRATVRLDALGVGQDLRIVARAS